MKIDIFAHIIPEKYAAAVARAGTAHPRVREFPKRMPPALFDLDARFRIMDRFEGMTQVLTLAEPPLENITDAAKAADLARAANDELAELVDKYPDRFIAAAAILPMNNIDAALKEVDRAVKDLGLKGVLLYSQVNDKPLDAPEFLPLYEKMAQYDLPMWIHPVRDADHADYRTEKQSIYDIIGMFDWPHETSVAMARLAFSGLLEKYPNLKFVTHHGGGTVPYLEGRMVEFSARPMAEEPRYAGLARPRVEYLKMFYADTATYGGVAGLTCAYRFFEAGHLLFGTDMPFSITEPSVSGVSLAIKGIEGMDIGAAERRQIYEGNARRLLRLL
jgi:aminocarboxymuconate-semialdehyde decarboxylase